MMLWRHGLLRRDGRVALACVPGDSGSSFFQIGVNLLRRWLHCQFSFLWLFDRVGSVFIRTRFSGPLIPVACLTVLLFAFIFSVKEWRRKKFSWK